MFELNYYNSMMSYLPSLIQFPAKQLWCKTTSQACRIRILGVSIGKIFLELLREVTKRNGSLQSTSRFFDFYRPLQFVNCDFCSLRKVCQSRWLAFNLLRVTRQADWDYNKYGILCVIKDTCVEKWNTFLNNSEHSIN